MNLLDSERLILNRDLNRLFKVYGAEPALIAKPAVIFQKVAGVLEVAESLARYRKRVGSAFDKPSLFYVDLNKREETVESIRRKRLMTRLRLNLHFPFQPAAS